MSLYQKYLTIIKTWLGRNTDFDGKYANQCVDWAKRYASELGYPIQAFGNAIDLGKKWLGPNWVRVKEGQVGDIVVFPIGVYGHIAVTARIEGKTLFVHEQNRNGMAYYKNNDKNFGSPISLGKYTLTGNEMWFRPKA